MGLSFATANCARGLVGACLTHTLDWRMSDTHTRCINFIIPPNHDMRVLCIQHWTCTDCILCSLCQACGGMCTSQTLWDVCVTDLVGCVRHRPCGMCASQTLWDVGCVRHRPCGMCASQTLSPITVNLDDCSLTACGRCHLALVDGADWRAFYMAVY